jgi:hypothetical protein
LCNHCQQQQGCGDLNCCRRLLQSLLLAIMTIAPTTSLCCFPLQCCCERLQYLLLLLLLLITPPPTALPNATPACAASHSRHSVGAATVTAASAADVALWYCQQGNLPKQQQAIQGGRDCLRHDSTQHSRAQQNDDGKHLAAAAAITCSVPRPTLHRASQLDNYMTPPRLSAPPPLVPHATIYVFKGFMIQHMRAQCSPAAQDKQDSRTTTPTLLVPPQLSCIFLSSPSMQ